MGEIRAEAEVGHALQRLSTLLAEVAMLRHAGGPRDALERCAVGPCPGRRN